MRITAFAIIALAVGCSRSTPPAAVKKPPSLQEERSRAAAMRAISIQDQEMCLRNDSLLLKNLQLDLDIARLQGVRLKKSSQLDIVRQLVADDESSLETSRETDRMITNLEKANGDDPANEDIPHAERKLFSNLLTVHNEYREKTLALIRPLATISPAPAAQR